MSPNLPSDITTLNIIPTPKESKMSQNGDSITSIKKTKKKKIYSKMIESFLKMKDVPLWWRALSHRQMLAADQLLNCLRDDTQQGTTHRTRLTLQNIGICPLPISSDIKIAMQWSRGNDLAFLWFMLELYYVESETLTLDAKPQEIEYDSNQQLLMSTIAHLDMITTLRELDKILPVNHYEPKDDKSKKPKKINKKIKKEYSIPYLAPLPRPKIVRKMHCPPPKESKPNIKPYEKYADPSYFVPNESNRWYAESSYIDSNSYGQMSDANIFRGTLNDEIKNVAFKNDDMNKQETVISAMYDKHKSMDEMQKLLVAKLRVSAREKCNKFLTLGDKSERLREKFNIQLEKDLQEVAEKFDELSQRYQTQTWLRLLIHELVDKSIDLKNVKLCNQIVSCSMESQLFENILEHSSLCPKEIEDNSNKLFDFQHFGHPKPFEKYFQAPKENLPYKFDYAKIFNDRDLTTVQTDPLECIKNSIEMAFDIKKYKDEDEAVKACLQSIWKCEVNSWNEKFKSMDENTENSKSKLEETTETNNVKRYYNPKDKYLMNSLLIDAFQQMRKNPKFVLVGLPEAYKLSTLQMWIRGRYGFVFTQKERDQALKRSTEILQAMRKVMIKLRKPKSEDISKLKYFSFDRREYILHKSQIVMYSYFERLKARLLEDTRVYWHAMEPFHCKSGAPREAFYAYLPSKPQDILPFRPWDRSHFMNAKQAWDTRMEQKRKKTAESF